MAELPIRPRYTAMVQPCCGAAPSDHHRGQIRMCTNADDAARRREGRVPMMIGSAMLALYFSDVFTLPWWLRRPFHAKEGSLVQSRTAKDTSVVEQAVLSSGGDAD